MLLDFLSDDPARWNLYRYVNDGVNPVGVGTSALAGSALYGPPPLLQPGTNSVVVAFDPGDVTPTGATRLVLRWVERYLNPWGDE